MVYKLQFISAPIESYSETLHSDYERKEYTDKDKALTDIQYLEECYEMLFSVYLWERQS